LRVLAVIIVSCSQTPQEGEPHYHLFAKPENYTPPTDKGEDCICGGHASGGKSRTLIANCPCCDGVQGLVHEACPKGVDCPNKAYIPMRVTLPPDKAMRLRYIDTAEAIV
jgi:hypothetical protein